MSNTPRGLHVHSRSEYSYPPPRRFVKNYFEFFGGLQMTRDFGGGLPDPHPEQVSTCRPVGYAQSLERLLN